MAALVLDIVIYRRVRPGAQYTKANPLLEKTDDMYASRYEDLYDPPQRRASPGIPHASASSLSVGYTPYTQGRRSASVGA